MRTLMVAWGVIVGAAALWTGRAPRPGYPQFLQGMTGFFPPHYGYSAYAVVPLLFLGPRWVRWAGAVTLLLSGNRASWVGAITGWVWNAKECRPFGCYCERRTRAILAAGLVLLAVIGGNVLKPYGSKGDSARVKIWKAAARQAWRAPGPFLVGIDGYAVTKAHSDVMQLAVNKGVPAAALTLLLLGWAFYRLPEGPAKAVVAALSAQSIIDNRLHHPACVALYAAAWLAAALGPRASGNGRTV